MSAQTDYYQRNKEKVAEYQRKYRKENQEFLRVRNRNKRRARWLEAIELLGGKCSKCHQIFDPVCYDFHHTDPKEKELTIGENMLLGKERLFKEIKKCVLLCANCHRLTHKELKDAN